MLPFKVSTCTQGLHKNDNAKFTEHRPRSDDDDDDDDDNNNNNIYLLQLGCHPVAVVILHANKT